MSEPRDTHKVIRDALELALPDAWAYDELADVVLEALTAAGLHIAPLPPSARSVTP